MSPISLHRDIERPEGEKVIDREGVRRPHLRNPTGSRSSLGPVMTPSVQPFVGRIGGNQSFVVDRDDEASAKVLELEPDAAPGMSLRQQFNLRSFWSLGLWKAAGIESFGTFMLVYITVWASISPNVLPAPPTPEYGMFANAAFIGPTVGCFINFLVLTLFTFAFGAVSGAHFNPTITLGTFFARLCTFPRAVLYVCAQSLGGALAGLLVRASYGSRDFKTGGCWLFPEVIPVKDAFVVEFMGCLVLLFLAFGVGLDPRQQKTIPPSLSPFLVGMALWLVSWSTAFARYGYGGASLNPSRCLGAFVGSHIPAWHWYHWVAPLCACVLHAVVYHMVPPGQAAFPS